MRITVLGATGGIGRAVTLELAARGHDVTAASRSIATAACRPGSARSPRISATRRRPRPRPTAPMWS